MSWSKNQPKGISLVITDNNASLLLALETLSIQMYFNQTFPNKATSQATTDEVNVCTLANLTRFWRALNLEFSKTMNAFQTNFVHPFFGS